jgi:hypothetical protein
MLLQQSSSVAVAAVGAVVAESGMIVGVDDTADSMAGAVIMWDRKTLAALLPGQQTDHYLAAEDVAVAVAAGRPDTIKEKAMPLRELAVVRSCFPPRCYFLH